MTKITDISHDGSSDTSLGDNEERRVQKFCRHMLRSSIFIGSFNEKRYVEPLTSYRDVVKISDDESDLIENLEVVRRRLHNFYLRTRWIGITDPKTVGAPTGHNIWVTLDPGIFGTYWFKIRNVEFRPDEICLKLQVLRPVIREQTPVLNITPHDLTRNDSLDSTEPIFTVANAKQATIFLGMFLATIATFLVHATKYLMEFSLRLIHELSGFVKVCNPTINTLIRFVFQTVMGLFFFIAALWNGSRQTPMPRMNMPMLQSPPYYARALPPPRYNNQRRPRSTVTITPLD